MINKLKSNLLLKNTLWMFVGLGGKTVLQLGYFIIIARSLGVNDYGAFTGIVALALIISPFSNLGLGHTLVKKVSRDITVFKEQWGKTLIVTISLGLLLTSVFIVLSYTFWSSEISLIVILSVSTT